MAIAYLDGGYLPLEEARVSVLDRGFLFGDGVYEVIPVRDGRPCLLERHLERLRASLREIEIDCEIDSGQWREVLGRLIEAHDYRRKSLYVQVTRGVSRRAHWVDTDAPPTVFAMCDEVAERDYGAGLAAIVCEDIRWRRCHIKAITLLPNVLLRRRAARAGADEAILLREEQVTEGAASNVFAVNDGVVRTPGKDGTILPGIARDVLVEALHRDGRECRESGISLPQLQTAEEIWLTSSTMQVAPVVRLDGCPVGDGRPGALWRTALELYRRRERLLSAGND